MYSLLSYFKVFENKLNESDSPENQYFDIGIYKNEHFNLNSFSKSIMTKVNDTNNLIKQLQIIAENTKNEIVEQISSNVNNYIVLISKLQAIDFLIENIDKPLMNIKNTILNEITFIERNEEELKKMNEFIKNNDEQIKNVLLSLRFYKYLQKSKENFINLKKRFIINNEIENIVSNYQDDDFLNYYDTLRKFLSEIFNIEGKIEILRNLNKQLNDIEQKNIEEIDCEENEIFYFMESLFKLILNRIFIKTEIDEHKSTLLKNLLILITKIYQKKNENGKFFEKIFETTIKEDFSKIFEEKNNNTSKTNSMTQKIEAIINLYEKKYNIINSLINQKDNDKFVKKCFIFPLIDKISNDKFIFNCVDPITFKDNYNSIVSCISKLLINKNSSSNNKLNNFIQSFSFFTYYQYIQNDTVKALLDDKKGNQQQENTDEFALLVKIFRNNSNMLFNYAKVLQDMFRDNKIFLKILPNFLNHLIQTNKFIISKQVQFLTNDDNTTIINKLLELLNQPNFSFEESNMSSLKNSCVDYLNYLYEYKKFFQKKLKNSLLDVIEKESFVFVEVEEKDKLIVKIDLIQQKIINSIDEQLFIEGSGAGKVILQIVGHDEIKGETKFEK
jgi:hypothetical protein